MTGGKLETLIEKGYAARRESRLDEAKGRFAEAVELCRMSDDPVLLARALAGLGQIESDLNRPDAALKCYGESVEPYRVAGRPLALAHTVCHDADLFRKQAKLDLAAERYREALSIYRSHEETPPLDLANALRGFMLLKSSEGDAEEATRL
ncbi:MAG: tetratricopeptide repeat protein [Terracidiphilus sp.]|jgi:tetratricopeptide (TPR) repeat protein